MILTTALLISNLIITSVLSITVYVIFGRLNINFFSISVQLGRGTYNLSLILFLFLGPAVIALILPSIFRFLKKISWLGFIAIFLGGLLPFIWFVWLGFLNTVFRGGIFEI